MSVANAAPAPLKSHPCTLGVGSPSGSSALAVTDCCIAVPTSVSVTSMQAAGLGAAVCGSGVGATSKATLVGVRPGVGARSVGTGVATESSPGVPQVAFRTSFAFASTSIVAKMLAKLGVGSGSGTGAQYVIRQRVELTRTAESQTTMYT